MSKKEIKKIEESDKVEPKKTPIALEDLKCGYVVGISEDEHFIFEIFGKNKNLVELLGVHAHASHRVSSIHNDQQVSGDRLVRELGRAVEAIGEKVDSLLGKEVTKEDLSAEVTAE